MKKRKLIKIIARLQANAYDGVDFIVSVADKRPNETYMYLADWETEQDKLLRKTQKILRKYGHE